MVRELQEMKDSSSGFESTTGKMFYFNHNQDSPGNYDLVNLNVSFFVFSFLALYSKYLEILLSGCICKFKRKQNIVSSLLINLARPHCDRLCFQKLLVDLEIMRNKRTLTGT